MLVKSQQWVPITLIVNPTEDKSGYAIVITSCQFNHNAIQSPTCYLSTVPKLTCAVATVFTGAVLEDAVDNKALAAPVTARGFLNGRY